jgi:hypothetical protein
MIQVGENVDRGQALFAKYEQAITNMVMSRKQQWFDSPQYRGLKSNCRQMDMYIDNNAAPASTFISDITPQTIRRGYNEYVSLFNKFLETDPLFSVRKQVGISPEQERAIMEFITNNLEKTCYRERCLSWSIDHIVRYGTAATYSFAVTDYNANSLMTVKDGAYEGTYRQEYQNGENAVVSTPIHPLNVIFDNRANFMIQPDFIGFIGDICVSNIATLLENPAYIRKNLNEVFEQCKKGLPDKHWFDGENTEVRNFSRGHSNISYMWTRLPFESNEDDPKFYTIELIGDKVIRIEENVLDSNTIPLAIKRILPRQYTWYGNSPLVDKICVQNLQYWLINTTVESTARLMDRIVLYRAGDLDVTAINSRHQTGGLVPYTGQETDMSKLLHSPEMKNPAYRENDWLMQLTRREDQDSSAMPNFNPQSEGGPTNKTLGGAQMMASIGEIKMARMVNDMCIGLKDVAKHHLILLRNIMTGEKDNILGNIQFTTKISNVFNYIREGIDSKNRLMDIINIKATKMPQAAVVKTGRFIEDFIRNSLKRENIDDYVDLNALKALDEKEAAVSLQPPQQPVAPGAGMAPMTGAGAAPLPPLGGPVTGKPITGPVPRGAI